MILPGSSTWTRRDGRKRETPIPQFIEVAGTTPALAKKIEKRLSPDVGKPIDNRQSGKPVHQDCGDGTFCFPGLQHDGEEWTSRGCWFLRKRSVLAADRAALDQHRRHELQRSSIQRGCAHHFPRFWHVRFRVAQRCGGRVCLSVGIGVLSSVYTHDPMVYRSAGRLEHQQVLFLLRQPHRIAIPEAAIWRSARCRVHLRQVCGSPSRLSGGLSKIFAGDRRPGHLPDSIGACRNHPVSLQP